jgi:hypothetical protein
MTTDNHQIDVQREMDIDRIMLEMKLASIGFFVMIAILVILSLYLV